VTQIITGFVDRSGSQRLPPIVSDLTSGAPISVIAAAASGGNATAIKVGAMANTTVSNVLGLVRGTTQTTTDLEAWLAGGVAPFGGRGSGGNLAGQSSPGQHSSYRY